jgi:hypothetical protein
VIFAKPTLSFQTIGNSSKVEGLLILLRRLFIDCRVEISMFGHQGNFVRGAALKLDRVIKSLSLNVSNGQENIGVGNRQVWLGGLD